MFCQCSWAKSGHFERILSCFKVKLPEPLGPKLFILGEPVLHRYYTVYDWEQKKVGRTRASMWCNLAYATHKQRVRAMSWPRKMAFPCQNGAETACRSSKKRLPGGF